MLAKTVRELAEQEVIVQQLLDNATQQQKAPVLVQQHKIAILANKLVGEIFKVVYLPKKLEQGPRDGTNPSKLPQIVRSVDLQPAERTTILVERLSAVILVHPQGAKAIADQNDAKWRPVLKEFLVDEAAANAITGGSFMCSRACLDEEDKNYQYKFLDNSRFQLHGCPHASHHVQCLVTRLIINEDCASECVIFDTAQCRNSLDASGKYGQTHFWAPEDYKNFAKAFLWNKALTDKFLKPELR